MALYCGNNDCAQSPCPAHSRAQGYCSDTTCDQIVPCSLHPDEGESLFSQLSALFAADPDIDEFGLVMDTTSSVYQPASSSSSASTPDQAASSPFMLVEHKLGVTYACIPLLLRYAVKRFHRLSRNAGTNAEELMQLTRVMLLVNADNYTAWNMRKKIIFPRNDAVISDEVMQRELKFLDLLFSKHPKSGEAWAHRRWVLDRAMSLKVGSWSKLRDQEHIGLDNSKKVSFQDRWLQREISVCNRSSELYPKNYYAWTHRHWVVSKLSNMKDILAALTKSRRWTDVNVGDNCGFNHRQALLIAFINSSPSHGPASVATTISNIPEPETEDSMHLRSTPVSTCSVCETWTTEFEYISKLQEFYTGHEVLWLHRRFLVKSFSDLVAKHHDVHDFTELLRSEMDFARSAIDNKDVERYDDNRRFAATYGLWLTFLENVPLELGCQFSEWRKSLAVLLPSIWGTATPVWPILAEIAAGRIPLAPRPIRFC